MHTGPAAFSLTLSCHLDLATVVDRSCGLALGSVDLRINEELQLPPFLSLSLSLPLLLPAFYFSLLQITFLHGMVSVIERGVLPLSL